MPASRAEWWGGVPGSNPELPEPQVEVEDSALRPEGGVEEPGCSSSDLEVVVEYSALVLSPRVRPGALPDLEPGQSVDDLHIGEEARWLVGFWLNGSGGPVPQVPGSSMIVG
jgi:hypothetical protein